MTAGGAEVSGYRPSSTGSRWGEGTELIVEIAQRAAQQAGVFLTARDVERLLAALQVTTNIWELAQRSTVPLLGICSVLRELIDRNYVEVQGERLRLTEMGEQLCRRAGIVPVRSVRCPSCHGRGVDIGVLGEVRDEFLKISADRPSAIRDYDQAYLVEEASLARVAFLLGKGDLEERDVLIIGDDDLISLAAGLTRAPRRILVLEVDERIVGFIRRVADRYGLPVEARVYNVCDPLPEELCHEFDTFVCDPSESFGGLTAFLTRCLLGLRGAGAAGVFGLSRHEASLRKWRDVQRWLLEREAVVTDIVAEFGQYHNWPYYREMRAWPLLPVHPVPERPWYQSCLYRVELLDRPHLENVPFSAEIFMDEEAATF